MSQNKYLSTSEEECESDSANDTDEDISNLFMGLQPYQFEPEKPHLTSSSSENSEEESEQQESNQQETSRAGNKLWCVCENCRTETREIDCLCCQEVAAISEEKFAGKSDLIIFISYRSYKIVMTVIL